MSTLAVALTLDLKSTLIPSSPYTGQTVADLNNGSTGARWTNGTGSAQCDRIYKKSGTLAASATDTLNLLAAGSLTDALGQAIDLDELKVVMVKCLTGSIKFVRAASNGAALFTAAGEGINLAAGQSVAVDLGAGGLSLSTNASLSITDTAGGSGSTYELVLAGAQ